MYSNSIEVFSGRPYSFLQVDGQEEQAVCGSYRNLEEAHRVVDLIHRFHSCAASMRDGKWHGVDRIRIITFYRAQVVLVQQLLNRRGLPRVLVATVDSSQGCEADVVIVSFVRSNCGRGRSPRYSAGFLTDDRRVNVALTRAKFQLICVGNVQAMTTMTPTSTLFGLASNAGQRQCVVRGERGVKPVFKKSDRKRQRTSSKDLDGQSRSRQLQSRPLLRPRERKVLVGTKSV
jgi:superfamily I DNA and/or RNA helicase